MLAGGVMKSPKDILQETSPQIKNLIDNILKIEKEYQYYQNLDNLKDKKNELCNRIVRVIEQESL